MTHRLSKRFVDSTLASKKDKFYWDADLKGFGLKVSSKGLKSYVVQYRASGAGKGYARRLSIGRHGSPWTAELARLEAKKILGRVAHGEDPLKSRHEHRKEMSVAELCDLYLVEGASGKKPSTLATDNGRIERHIKPLLGAMSVADVSKVNIRSFMEAVASGKLPQTASGVISIKLGGRGTASRTVGLLGGIFSFAIEIGLRNDNPVHGVKRPPDRKSKKFLTSAQLLRLLELLAEFEAQGANLKAVMIIKLLALTGARRGEIEQLMWSEISFAERSIHFEDSKTGQKSIPVSPAVIEILENAKDFRCSGCPYVFPNERADRFYVGTPKVWKKLRSQFGDETLRMHDLRHSFASLAVAGGASLPMIGALLGHRDVSTTQQYAHLTADPLRAITDHIQGVLTVKKKNESEL